MILNGFNTPDEGSIRFGFESLLDPRFRIAGRSRSPKRALQPQPSVVCVVQKEPADGILVADDDDSAGTELFGCYDGHRAAWLVGILKEVAQKAEVLSFAIHGDLGFIAPARRAGPSDAVSSIDSSSGLYPEMFDVLEDRMISKRFNNDPAPSLC